MQASGWLNSKLTNTDISSLFGWSNIHISSKSLLICWKCTLSGGESALRTSGCLKWTSSKTGYILRLQTSTILPVKGPNAALWLAEYSNSIHQYISKWLLMMPAVHSSEVRGEVLQGPEAVWSEPVERRGLYLDVHSGNRLGKTWVHVQGHLTTERATTGGCVDPCGAGHARHLVVPGLTFKAVICATTNFVDHRWKTLDSWLPWWEPVWRVLSWDVCSANNLS